MIHFNSTCVDISFKRRMIIILLCLMSAFILHAQNGSIDWPEKIVAYYLQKQPEKCIHLAEQVMANHSGRYTSREAMALVMGACGYLEVEPQKLSYVDSIIYKPLIDDMIISDDSFSLMNKEQKKQYIKDYTDKYEFVIVLSLQIDAKARHDDKYDISKTMALFEFYHNNIYAYRNVFDSSDPTEAVNIATILRQEAHYLKLIKRYDALLLNLYPELISLKKNNSELIDFAIFGAVNVFKNDIIEFGFTKQGKNYLKERADFILQLNELSLNNLGYKAANKYDTINWQNIKNILDVDECAVMMYDYNLLSATSLNLINGIVITSEQEQPEDLKMVMETSSPDAFIKQLESKYPNCKRFYICPFGKWENVDVAYDNPRVHMKHSLIDIARYPKSLHYNGGIISIFADINYGDKSKNNDVPMLKDGKLIVSKAKELFGNKIYSLSGNNVKRVNFFNILDDVSIFHVSTHGIAQPKDISPKDTMDLYNFIYGNTSMQGFGLALSNYNENHSRNFVSAKDVKDQIKLTGNQLVYLDACETGLSNQKNFFGPNGLAKSFYFAGAKNVIAYITEVNENVATDFALAFYRQLHETPNESYHDIFYSVKKQIIQKYSNFLAKDDFGRPNLGILLWE